MILDSRITIKFENDDHNFDNTDSWHRNLALGASSSCQGPLCDCLSTSFGVWTNEKPQYWRPGHFTIKQSQSGWASTLVDCLSWSEPVRINQWFGDIRLVDWLSDWLIECVSEWFDQWRNQPLLASENPSLFIPFSQYYQSILANPWAIIAPFTTMKNTIYRRTFMIKWALTNPVTSTLFKPWRTDH